MFCFCLGDIGGRCSDCRPGSKGDKGERGFDGFPGATGNWHCCELYTSSIDGMKCENFLLAKFA